jgi:hypothetical protein
VSARPRLAYDQRVAQAIQSMMPGAFGGRIASASPVRPLMADFLSPPAPTGTPG